jgi:hypothetical protein
MNITDHDAVVECARQIADAIGRRDVSDWFIRDADAWRIRVAVDLPSPESAG